METATSVNINPAPSPLKLGSDIAADWERFQNGWSNYEVAVDLSDVVAKKRAAVGYFSLRRNTVSFVPSRSTKTTTTDTTSTRS